MTAPVLRPSGLDRFDPSRRTGSLGIAPGIPTSVDHQLPDPDTTHYNFATSDEPGIPRTIFEAGMAIVRKWKNELPWSVFCQGLAVLETVLPPSDSLTLRQAAVIDQGPAARLGDKSFLCASFDILRVPFYDRLRGRRFGKAKLDLYARHTTPSPYIILHFAWDFLSPGERAFFIQESHYFESYARLRRAAFRRWRELPTLRLPRPPIEHPPQLSRERSWLLGMALISFNFIHGDVVRWMGNEYTNAHRDWDRLDSVVAEARQHPPLPGAPKVDYDRTVTALKEGSPLTGEFECRWDHTLVRDAYDNHPPLQDAMDAVREKFATEEAYCYHIMYPRCVVPFIYGLFLIPVSWVVQKGKGRIIHDASAKLFTGDTGAPNDYIPKPGENEDESPTVYYGTALNRHMTYAYNVRICHPREEIVQHGDDVDAAFRRMLLHPDIAIVYAYVFMEYLGIPCGMIFGGRASPGWYCLSAEMRAHIGNVCDFSTRPHSQLVQETQLAPPRPASELATIPIAVPDEYNTGINIHERSREHNTMFVDDNIVATLREYITTALHAAVESAFAVYGHPDDDPRRPSVMRDDKWCRMALEAVLHLGYEIDTHAMTLGWPDDKRHNLLELIDRLWSRWPCKRTMTEIAAFLGLTRHACYVCPLGGYLSIRLTHLLADHARHAGMAAIRKKSWWKYHSVDITEDCLADIRLLRQNLGDQHKALWKRPIGLLIKREPTSRSLGDAAYTGIGGWSPAHKFLWRITREELIAMGFPMHELLPRSNEPVDPADPDKLHINVLEFITLIIQLWLSLFFAKKEPNKPGGHIIELLADNTSALSWLRYATRTKKRIVRHLAIFAQYLLTFSGTSDFVQLTGCHKPGKLNCEADACSRPELYATLDCVIAEFSHMSTFNRILIPSALMSTILQLVSSPKIGAALEKEMIAATKLAPRILPAGQMQSDLTSNTFSRSRRTRRSRR